jgi:hypothetical protein
MRVEDWHQIEQIAGESRFSEALACALQICRVCRRYQLPDGCYGCDLKKKRKTLTELIAA